MDPLSLSASVITVITAAGASAKLLKKVKDFRHLPAQLCALFNEISDLRGMLEILKGLGNEEASVEVQGTLIRLMKRAEKAFSELEELLKTTLVNADDAEEYAPLRVSRSVWVRKQNKIKRLQTELRDVRTCLEITMISLNSYVRYSTPKSCVDLSGPGLCLADPF